MANLAQIAGLYGFLLFDWQSAADSTLAVTFVGVIWIAVMTAICVIGIELSARTQVGLLGAEVITLALFAFVALYKVYAGDALDGSIKPELSWFSPFAISSTDGLVAGLLVAVFIYWGWDSTVCVNEETTDSGTTPGKAAIASTVILVGIYVLVATAAVAFAGAEAIAERRVGRHARAARHRGARHAAGQDRDHRGAHLGGGLDADDDPADRAHLAVDGAREGDAGEPRASSTRASRRRTSRRS